MRSFIIDMPQEFKRENAESETGISKSENPHLKEAVKNLDKNQKISLVFLAVFALAVVILGSVQMRNNIHAPFNIPAAIKAKIKANELQLPASNTDLVSNDRTVDTDHDGVSDWDETSIYGTSPYLEDSDSDGFTDFEEIKNGTDPNCPKGQTCSSSLGSSAAEVPVSSIASTSSQILIDSGSASSTLDFANAQILQDILDGKGDIKAIRQLLIDTGMDKTQLDKISDEDLLKSYEENLKNPTSTPTPTPTPIQ